MDYPHKKLSKDLLEIRQNQPRNDYVKGKLEELDADTSAMRNKYLENFLERLDKGEGQEQIRQRLDPELDNAIKRRLHDLDKDSKFRLIM